MLMTHLTACKVICFEVLLGYIGYLDVLIEHWCSFRTNKHQAILSDLGNKREEGRNWFQTEFTSSIFNSQLSGNEEATSALHPKRLDFFQSIWSLPSFPCGFGQIGPWISLPSDRSRMSGRGKGGKGLGKGGAKRHRKVLRDNIQVTYCFVKECLSVGV